MHLVNVAGSRVVAEANCDRPKDLAAVNHQSLTSRGSQLFFFFEQLKRLGVSKDHPAARS
jgi:hypothetical protein